MTGEERKYFLRSERLGFAAWTESDMDRAWELWGDPQVTKFIGGPFARERVESRVRMEMKNGEKHGLEYWPLFLLETGKFIGVCGLRPYKEDPADSRLPPGLRVCELGFSLKKEFWGRGYATEAAGAAIKYAFGELKFQGIVAGHHPQNAASKRTLMKLGFEHFKNELYPPTGLSHPLYLLKSNKI